MTQSEIIRNDLNKSDWEITKDKCDSTGAHRRHLAANGKHENKRKIYCTNVHLRIIEILITMMYKFSAVTAAVTVLRAYKTHIFLRAKNEQTPLPTRKSTRDRRHHYSTLTDASTSLRRQGEHNRTRSLPGFADPSPYTHYWVSRMKKYRALLAPL